MTAARKRASIMRLYVGVYSGYSQKVRIALAEKGLSDRVECVVVPIDEKLGPEHRARNPLGLVPVLELDDGSYLPESTAIIEYLDALHPDPPLVPADPLARARMRVLDRYNDQALTPAVRRLWNAVQHPGPDGPNGSVVEAETQAIHDVYRHLDAQLDAGPYLVGEFSIADIAFMQRLQLLPQFGVHIPEEYTRARAWETRLQARPSWGATMYPPLPPPTPRA